MNHLTREQFLSHRPPKFEDVPVPELGDKDSVIRIRQLSSSEMERFVASLWVTGPDDKVRYNRQDYAAKLVALAAITPSGERLFKDADVMAIGEQASDVVQRLAVVAEQLAGLQAKQVESAEKN